MQAYRDSKDETLPHELILSIQRVLNIQSGPEADPLDDLSDEFNPVGILNGIFPEGRHLESGSEQLNLKRSLP